MMNDPHDEAAQLRHDAVEARDAVHAIIGNILAGGTADGIPVSEALELAKLHASLSLAIEQRRTADAMERIADRLDSWTHEPRDGEFGTEPDAGGPELRVRRW